MYLSRLFLMPTHREVQRDLSDPHQMHRRVMSAFGQVQPREGTPKQARKAFEVLFRADIDRSRGRTVLYVQSSAKPDFSSLPAGYLMDMDGELPNPAVREVGEAWNALHKGQRLRFVLRANPTKKIKTKSGEDGRRRHGDRIPVSGDEGRLTWLSRKATEAGFDLLPVDGHPHIPDTRIHEEPKTRAKFDRSSPAKQAITFEPVLYEGRLVITDPERFKQALQAGIGPSKAYGCGLLSIAPE